MMIDQLSVVAGTVPATGSMTGVALGTGAAATAVSLSSIDLGTARDIGEGEDVFFMIHIIAAVTGATSVQWDAIYATDDVLTAGVIVGGSTGAIPVAALTIGSVHTISVNPLLRYNATTESSKGARYLGLRYIVIGTASAGSYCGYITLNPQDGKKFYASGFIVA
jgi:hypothetical protein